MTLGLESPTGNAHLPFFRSGETSTLLSFWLRQRTKSTKFRVILGIGRAVVVESTVASVRVALSLGKTEMEGSCGVSEPSVFSTYEAGWVYILSNAGHPDILKIGYTRRSVEHRIDQLNTTGTPYKHTLRFAWHVQNPAYLEGEIHRALAYCRIEGKEFFKVALTLAVVESNRVIAEKGVKVFDMLGVVPSETKPALHQVAAPPARRPAPRAQARSRPIDGQMTTEVASRGKASVALRWIPLVSSPHWQK